MRTPLLAGMLVAALAVPAGAADLALLPYKAATAGYSPWFFYMGLEAGGAVTNHSFDFLGTGTGTVEIGGALAGVLGGIEYKSGTFMFRAEVDADYDFGRGGANCMGMGVGCNIRHGGVITERVDLGLPQAWLGGATPGASVGAQERQDFASVAGIGSAGQWAYAMLAGAFIDIPAGTVFSIGARWDHVWPGQSIAIGGIPAPVVANTAQSDIFKLNLKWRLN